MWFKFRKNCLLQGILIDSPVYWSPGSQLQIITTTNIRKIQKRGNWNQEKCMMKNTGDEKSHDTVPLNGGWYVAYTTTTSEKYKRITEVEAYELRVTDLSLPVHLPPSCTLGHSPRPRDRSRHRRPAGSAADWSLGQRGLAVPPLARSQAGKNIQDCWRSFANVSFLSTYIYYF